MGDNKDSASLDENESVDEKNVGNEVSASIVNELSASILDEVTEDWEDEHDGVENSGIPANTSTPIAHHSGYFNFF